MRISISSKTFDLDGHVTIEADSPARVMARWRRAAKTNTLDGGVRVTDRGGSQLEEPLEYTWKSQAIATSRLIGNIVDTYSQVYVSNPDGVFLAVPERFIVGEEESTLTLLPFEKVSV